MHDVLSRLDGEEFLGLCGILLGLVGLLGGLGLGLAKIMSGHYRKVQLDEMEATLKMEMIQRGMSADEIAKVLEARMSSAKSPWHDVLAKLPKMPPAPAMRGR
jgi:hypothetical protein